MCTVAGDGGRRSNQTRAAAISMCFFCIASFLSSLLPSAPLSLSCSSRVTSPYWSSTFSTTSTLPLGVLSSSASPVFDLPPLSSTPPFFSFFSVSSCFSFFISIASVASTALVVSAGSSSIVSSLQLTLPELGSPVAAYSSSTRKDTGRPMRTLLPDTAATSLATSRFERSRAIPLPDRLRCVRVLFTAHSWTTAAAITDPGHNSSSLSPIMEVVLASSSSDSEESP